MKYQTPNTSTTITNVNGSVDTVLDGVSENTLAYEKKIRRKLVNHDYSKTF